jgi:hypothetical protein
MGDIPYDTTLTDVDISLMYVCFGDIRDEACELFTAWLACSSHFHYHLFIGGILRHLVLPAVKAGNNPWCCGGRLRGHSRFCYVCEVRGFCLRAL